MADHELSGEALAASPAPGSSPYALTLGHILTSMGGDYEPRIEPKQVRVIRHVFRPGKPGHLQGPDDLTEERLLGYTQWQGTGHGAIPADPGEFWVVFIADGKRRSRLWGTYENFGQIPERTTPTGRCFDLRPSSFLAPLAGRLVVEWDKSTLSWHRRGSDSASKFPVLEIADRDKIEFPGFDGVLLTFPALCQMVDEEDHRYADWRAALSEVQGIYLITDSKNGRQYVGKADGAERILGRWRTYAQDGHGGNVALRKLARESAATGSATTKTDHAQSFVFSLLRVFGPSTPSSTVDAAESHFKQALMTRDFGLNKN